MDRSAGKLPMGDPSSFPPGRRAPDAVLLQKVLAASKFQSKLRKNMPYNAEISRGNPSCFIFLMDQSGSMADAWGGEAGKKKV
jgi:hypothetical protein